MVQKADYGFSIDLGTSQITIHLIDRIDGRIVGSEILPNPQMEFGLDIISRLDFFLKTESNASRITGVVRSSIYDSFKRIMSQHNVNSEDVSICVLVGNTVMHHLFYGISPKSLSRPPFAASSKDPIEIPASEVELHLGGNAKCYSPPIIESFIGPDALMLLLEAGVLESENNIVAVDVGTNTEIAVRSKRGLWMCSAASGPAFEGMSLECGMQAEKGAITGVEINPDYTPKLTVMESDIAHGICGSGVISILASLVQRGIMNTKGSLQRNIDSPWIEIHPTGVRYKLTQDVHFSQFDVRMIQQSKAAIAGAMRLLLRKAQCSPTDVDHFFLTGAFGTGLDLEKAYRIGLFPRFDNAKVKQMKGGAIQGADRLVREPHLRSELDSLPNKISYIELTDNPEFQEYFLKSQAFLPLTD